MRLSKPVIVAAAVVMLGIIGLAAWWQRPEYRRPITFHPPYPQVDEAGASILAVFEGRIPFFVANCEKRKVGLVLYHDGATSAPSSYWLGVIGVGLSNEREVTQGTWTIRRGAEEYPEAVVYELDRKAPDDLRRYWRLTQDILLPLDQTMRPKPGNSAWGFMLSRHAAPYGPRTYWN